MSRHIDSFKHPLKMFNIKRMLNHFAPISKVRALIVDNVPKMDTQSKSGFHLMFRI